MRFSLRSIVLIAIVSQTFTTTLGVASEFEIGTRTFTGFTDIAAGTTWPQLLDNVWQIETDIAGTWTYKGKAVPGETRAFVRWQKTGGWQQVSSMFSADQTWSDVVFHCEDGRASVDAVANLRIKGQVSFTTWEGGPFTVRLRFGGGNNQPEAAWEVGSGAYGSTAPFTDVPGESIDGIYQIPLRINVPTGQPVDVSMGHSGAGNLTIDVTSWRSNTGIATACASSTDLGLFGSFRSGHSPVE